MDNTTYQDLKEREAERQHQRMLDDYSSFYARTRGYDD